MENLKELNDLLQTFVRLYGKVESGKVVLPKKKKKKKAPTDESIRRQIKDYLSEPDGFMEQETIRSLIFRHIARKPEFADIDLDSLLLLFATNELEELKLIRRLCGR